jgi:hypothetical protein
MVQVWILRSDVDPVTATRTGADVSICGDCVHRPIDSGGQGTCYVTVWQAPRAIYQAYRAGRYVRWAPSVAARMLAGRVIRWGAYGDPAALPVDLLRRLSAAAAGHTGYTHQWRRFPSLRSLLMASTDSDHECRQASARGWRFFSVGAGADSGGRVISCPASAESGKRTTCAQCRLCDGAREGDRRASITIQPHGTKALTFYRRAV